MVKLVQEVSQQSSTCRLQEGTKLHENPAGAGNSKPCTPGLLQVPDLSWNRVSEIWIEALQDETKPTCQCSQRSIIYAQEKPKCTEEVHLSRVVDLSCTNVYHRGSCPDCLNTSILFSTQTSLSRYPFINLITISEIQSSSIESTARHAFQLHATVKNVRSCARLQVVRSQN